MTGRYSILAGMLMSTTLLPGAKRHYPGGLQYHKNSAGHEWRNNYHGNLFNNKAINGSGNSSKLWAFCGVFFLCIGLALFFTGFSKKISSKALGRIIKYLTSVLSYSYFWL